MTLNSIPAVVVGIDTPIGLAVTRDLGKSKIAVYGIARNAAALGMSSRYLHKGLVRAADKDDFIEQLVDLGNELGSACLFAISESDITFLNGHRARLGAFKLMFADEDRMNIVLNKDLTYQAAEKTGIFTPRTVQLSGPGQMTALCADLRFPVVLKWANPHSVVRALAAAKLKLEKIHYCHSLPELESYLRPFEELGIFPLIQEYCPGYGLGQFILMKDGDAKFCFQHKRVHEWPPEGGFSSLCESLPIDSHQDLMAKSVALLREIGWEGIAMVEYRHDPATGNSALMEVNGRFWGSLPLAYHAKARFPTLCYELLGMQRDVRPQPYRAGIRCRYMVPETKRLMRILFAQGKISDKKLKFRRGAELFTYIADFLRPSTRYYVFEFADPKPLLADVGQMLRKAINLPKPAARPAQLPHASDKGRNQL